MHSIINLNKPFGMTSRQAVTKVQRLLGAKKAGHAGTLDPQATGVLLICLNESTKISRFLLNMDKQYRATIKLGERTDTYDAWGKIIEKKDISSLSAAELADAVEKFKGPLEQKPPMYSAVKIGGKKLYKLARKGIEIERPARTIQIYDIAITSIDLPFFEIILSCSKGTYVRSLCDDIGMELGTGAHMTALERTAVGFFHVKDSFSFDNLLDNVNQFCSIDRALGKLPEILLDPPDYRKTKNGVKVCSAAFAPYNGEFVRLKDAEGHLFAVGRVDSSVLSIERNLNIE